MASLLLCTSQSSLDGAGQSSMVQKTIFQLSNLKASRGSVCSLKDQQNPHNNIHTTSRPFCFVYLLLVQRNQFFALKYIASYSCFFFCLHFQRTIIKNKQTNKHFCDQSIDNKKQFQTECFVRKLIVHKLYCLPIAK